MSGKYAPAREDGLKPWLVTVTEWGRSRERIEWAETNAQACSQARGRMRYTYARARRATPADLERLKQRV